MRTQKRDIAKKVKVNIEVQSLCKPQDKIRGVDYVILNLLKTLVERNRYEYSVSFFDFKKERGNRYLLDKYLTQFGINDKIGKHECNDLSYREISGGWNDYSEAQYINRSYESYIGADSEVYYFPHTMAFPANLPLGKTVMTVHDITPIMDETVRETNNNLYRRMINIMSFLKKRDDILYSAVSYNTKKDFCSYTGISEDRVTVVYNAYDSNMFYHEENYEVLKKKGINKPYLLYLGGIDKYKGVEILSKAASGICKERGMQLVYAGAAVSWFDIKELMSRDEVIITGYVTDEEKRVLMSSAEIFVFPSFYEGFGLPVIETMACGTPVITTNSSSLPEVGGEAARYVDVGNVEELAEAINKVLDDSELRADMIKKGYENCRRFSWDKTAEQLENIFKRVVDKSN